MSKKNYRKKAKKSLGMKYIPFYLIVTLLPHLFLYEEYTPLRSERFYFKADKYIDLLMLAKSRLFLAIAAAILLIFVFQIIYGKIKFRFDNFTKASLLFFVCALASVIFSEYKDIAIWGAKDRFEGLLTITGYLVMINAGRYYFTDPVFRERLKKVFLFSALLAGIIGILQISDIDVYKDTFLKYFLIPLRVLQEGRLQIVSNYDVLGATASLYNPNYFGVFMALAIGITTTALFSSKSKTFYHVCNLVFVFSLYASRSEAGFLGVTAFLIVYFALDFKKILTQKSHIILFFIYFFGTLAFYHVLKGVNLDRYQYLVAALAGGIIGGIFINLLLINKLKLANSIKSMILTALIVISLVSGMIVFIYISPVNQRVEKINSIEVVDNKLLMNVDGQGDIRAVFNENTVQLSINDEVIQLIPGEMEYRLTYVNEGLRYTFDFYKNEQMEGTDQFICHIWPGNLRLLYAAGKLYYLDLADNIVEIQNPEGVAFLDKRSSVFTNRGFIWSRSIPMILEKPLLGYGPDTFVMHYPQNDFAGIYNNLRVGYKGVFEPILIDKPHSVYLQVFLGMGIINGVLFCIFLIFGIYMGIKDFLDNNEDPAGLSVLLIFIVGSVFNDSIIPVTAVCLCFITFIYRIKQSREKFK